MSQNVGEIDLGLSVNQGQFNRQLNSIAGSAKTSALKMFTPVGAAIGSAMSVKALVGFGASCVQLGSDLTEVQNVVDTTFGSMSEQLNEFASGSIKNLGMSETACKEYASTMGAILKSTGFATKDAYDMSTALTQLTGDMASFYNKSNPEMFEKIRAGITGETEPLKALGINMSVANLQAYALSKGIKKSYDKMSQGEQTLLRYNYLLSVTKDAQGDLARTSDSWANQTRILNEQWKQFKTNIGKGLINVLTPVVKWLNVLLEKLQAVGEWFARITGMTFGDASAGGDGGIADTSIYDNAANAAGGLENAIDDAGDAAKNAGKKAKKAGELGLAAFDELNQLNNPSDGGDGSGGSGGKDSGDGGAGDALGSLGGGADKLQNKVGTLKKSTDGWLDSMANKLREIADLLADLLSRLLSIKPDMGLNWDSEKNKDKSIVTKYKTVFDDDSANKALDKANKLRNDIDSIFGKKKMVQLFLDDGNVFSKLQEVNSKLNSLQGKKIKISLDDAGVNTGLDNIKVSLTALGNEANNTHNGPLSRLWEFIKNSFKIDTVTAFELISNTAKASLNNTGSFLNSCMGTAKNVGGFFKNVLTLDFSGAFGNIKNTADIWKGHMGKCFENTKSACSNHTDTLKNFVVAKWQNLKELVTGHSTSMKNGITGDMDKSKKSAEGFGNYLSNTLAPKTSTALDTIKAKFASLWSSIKNGCKDALNGVIGKINGLIGGLNKLSFKMPDALGGGQVGFSIPKIPMLARGGVVDQPTLAMIGEAGKEAVVPLENNTEWVQKMASTIASALLPFMQGGGGGNATNRDIVINVDSVELVRAFLPTLIKEANRQGLQG